MTTKTWVLGVLSAGVVAAGLAVGLADAPKPVDQPGRPQWVTITDRVVFPKDKPLPAKQKLNVQADKEHCLAKGNLYADDVVIDPTTRGVKNVWVYLRPDTDDRTAKFAPADVHPALATPMPTEHVVDQPCCQFVPRILAVRAGDTVRFKNSSPIPHNINLSGDANPAFNVLAPPGMDKVTVPLAAEGGPLPFKCDIHPWMGGRIMVFDHPYFALTAADGTFEIKTAPAGKLRIVYRHENGFHKGAAGARGWSLAGTPDAHGTLELPPLEFEWP